ncbi:hypothetical protein GWO43_10480 [candidate division KSB1 bacterium]|nr:hypothetical protein [candidate division KSB1 bacterium]NIR69819.1 hypothetical protein [candidate division KSB1 bacterium]NIS24366.1 hypothetical protein [candidate division KSB1 bacterium]NIT71301.1 hypothetical protein [candidate division KSB1 bacterium]NIU27597.1 hypothetical protein [candidate division KSB1 bacterium]
MQRKECINILIVYLVLLQTTLIAQTQDSFSIGIVQADGIIIPVASYDGNKWTNPWAKQRDFNNLTIETTSDIPRTWLVSNRPISQKWFLQHFRGRLSEVNVIRPIYAKNHCGESWGLLVDMPKEPIDCDNCCPFPKVGYALDQNHPFSKIAEIGKEDLTYHEVLSLIQQDFDKLEASALADIPQKPISAAYSDIIKRISTTKKEPSIERLYPVYVSTNRTVFYFEAVKKYEIPDYCPIISFFRGWVSKNKTDGTSTLLNKDYQLTDCDMKEATFLKPYASMKIDERIYVFANISGWESEEYAIVEIKDSQISELLKTFIHGF